MVTLEHSTTLRGPLDAATNQYIGRPSTQLDDNHRLLTAHHPNSDAGHHCSGLDDVGYQADASTLVDTLGEWAALHVVRNLQEASRSVDAPSGCCSSWKTGRPGRSQPRWTWTHRQSAHIYIDYVACSNPSFIP